jgi:hypothetical protein
MDMGSVPVHPFLAAGAWPGVAGCGQAGRVGVRLGVTELFCIHLYTLKYIIGAFKRVENHNNAKENL